MVSFRARSNGRLTVVLRLFNGFYTIISARFNQRTIEHDTCHFALHNFIARWAEQHIGLCHVLWVSTCSGLARALG